MWFNYITEAVEKLTTVFIRVHLFVHIGREKNQNEASLHCSISFSL